MSPFEFDLLSVIVGLLAGFFLVMVAAIVICQRDQRRWRNERKLELRDWEDFDE